MDCLFSDVSSTCLGSSSEHIIQKGLGGRHESTEIICDTCNHYFGEGIDPGLCNYYSLLIDVLRPLMYSGYRKIQRDTTSLEESIPLIRKAGGGIALRKVHKEYKPDGSIKAIYMPGDLSREQRASILAGHQISDDKNVSYVPLTDLTPCAMSKHHFVFGTDEHRAAAKSIIEVLDWQTRSLGIKLHARSLPLRSARNYIRNGKFSEYIGRMTPPMYSLADKLNEIFGNQEKFSNRVLFCNDVRENRCFGLLQIARTMPLGLCFGESVDADDFTLLYETGLIQADSDLKRSEFRNELLISYRQFRSSDFVVCTTESNDFAFMQLNKSIGSELGRATILIDLQMDDIGLEMLRQFAVYSIRKNQTAGNELPRAICEQLVRLRFSSYSVSESVWDEVFNGKSITDFDCASLESSIKKYESLGSQGFILLKYYRDIIRLMVARYGYPQLLTRL